MPLITRGDGAHLVGRAAGGSGWTAAHRLHRHHHRHWVWPPNPPHWQPQRMWPKAAWHSLLGPLQSVSRFQILQRMAHLSLPSELNTTTFFIYKKVQKKKEWEGIETHLTKKQRKTMNTARFISIIF